jgi:hypothetical protein
MQNSSVTHKELACGNPAPQRLWLISKVQNKNIFFKKTFLSFRLETRLWQQDFSINRERYITGLKMIIFRLVDDTKLLFSNKAIHACDYLTYLVILQAYF